MELTTKQTRYVKAVLEGKTQEEAGLAAGSKTIEGARKLATRMSRNVQVMKALESSQEMSLTEAGITRTKALKPIGEALEATKIIVHGKNSEDSWVDEVPDYPIRLKAADMALKLLGQKDEDKPLQFNDIDLENMDEVELNQAVFRKAKVVKSDS